MSFWKTFFNSPYSNFLIVFSQHEDNEQIGDEKLLERYILEGCTPQANSNETNATFTYDKIAFEGPNSENEK